MSKNLTRLLAIIFAMSLLATACGGSDAAPEAADSGSDATEDMAEETEDEPEAEEEAEPEEEATGGAADEEETEAAVEDLSLIHI